MKLTIERAALLKAGSLKSAPTAQWSPAPRETSARARFPSPPERVTAQAATSGNDSSTADPEAAIERASAAAGEWHRRETLRRFLAAITLRSLAEEPEHARAVVEWVAQVHEQLRVTDPVEQVITSLKSAAATGCP